MIYTNLKSEGAHRIGVDHGSACASKRAGEYDTRKRGTKASVYSPHCVLKLVYSHGICAGCHGEYDLIDAYCATCRACGANERQCVNTGLIGRSEQGRINSQKSMWRMKRHA
jgi:hypothetical protein